MYDDPATDLPGLFTRARGDPLMRVMRARDPNLPAGPRLPPILQSLSWVFRPIEFMNRSRETYGNTFTISLAGMPPLVATGEPALIKEIFTGDPAVFNAGRGNLILKPILGAHSLLLLDGERHLKERRLMMPAFHGERMQAYGDVMRASIDRAIDGWPVERPFAIHAEMQEVTLDVILKTVFGVSPDADQTALRRALVTMLGFGEHPGLLLLISRKGELRLKSLHDRLGAWSPWGAFQKVIREVDRRIGEQIADRRARGTTGREDVLSLLLDARDEEGRGLTDAELIDEMKTLLVAGHETTATALTWTLLELLRHQIGRAHV
mgnify:CR=1 FL=1